jgi:hypothetical protein
MIHLGRLKLECKYLLTKVKTYRLCRPDAQALVKGRGEFRRLPIVGRPNPHDPRIAPMARPLTGRRRVVGADARLRKFARSERGSTGKHATIGVLGSARVRLALSLGD